MGIIDWRVVFLLLAFVRIDTQYFVCVILCVLNRGVGEGEEDGERGGKGGEEEMNESMDFNLS